MEEQTYDITVVGYDRTSDLVKVRAVWEHPEKEDFIATASHELIQEFGHADVLIKVFFN